MVIYQQWQIFLIFAGHHGKGSILVQIISPIEQFFCIMRIEKKIYLLLSLIISIYGSLWTYKSEQQLSTLLYQKIKILQPQKNKNFILFKKILFYCYDLSISFLIFKRLIIKICEIIRCKSLSLITNTSYFPLKFRMKNLIFNKLSNKTCLDLPLVIF